MFPTLPGYPVSYLPFKVTTEAAANIFNQMQCRTAHDIKLHYDMRGSDVTKKAWYNKFRSLLNPNTSDVIREEDIDDYFEMIHPGMFKMYD